MTRSDAQAIAPMPGHPSSVCISASEPVSSETPSTKPQAPLKIKFSCYVEHGVHGDSGEIPNLKTPNPQNRCRAKRRAGRFLSLELGASLDLGVWNLELLTWSLCSSETQMRPARKGVHGFN